MSLLAIIGRLPAISIAELESVFGPESIRRIESHAVELETNIISSDIFESIGGTLKVAQQLRRTPNTNWHIVTKNVEELISEIAGQMPEGKATLGISVHGLNVNARQINGTALALKKALKKSGRSVRVVPNSEPALNTAQVMHNKLAGPNGIEIIIIKDGNAAVIGRTVWSQNIDDYARRDQARPMRDARVGMLPPKLAQTIIHLAGAKPEINILDPFCGTGVLLQEALLMGCRAIGSDIEPRMIEYSKGNLKWLGRDNYSLTIADATSHTWQEKFDAIASETYLGRPLTSLPSSETLNKIIQDCNTIHKKFLQNVARQTKSGFRMCVAVPAWKTRNSFKHLPVLDHLEELGYNRLSFVHANNSELIYHREGQIVARELVVLIKK